LREYAPTMQAQHASVFAQPPTQWLNLADVTDTVPLRAPFTQSLICPVSRIKQIEVALRKPVASRVTAIVELDGKLVSQSQVSDARVSPAQVWFDINLAASIENCAGKNLRVTLQTDAADVEVYRFQRDAVGIQLNHAATFLDRLFLRMLR